MKEFLAQNHQWILGVLVVGIFLIQAARVLKRMKEIERDGVETDGVVSRIDETYDPDTQDSSYTVYVRYTDNKGQVRESPAALSDAPGYSQGDTVKIRYKPGAYDVVKIVG